MLVQLGDFTVAQAGPDEDHPYLPEAAMALIGDYQRSPHFAAHGEASEEDSTSASYTELPAGLPAAFQPPRRPPHGAKSHAKSHAKSRAKPGAGWLGWVRTHLAWVGWASVGAALVVAGVILGASLTSSSSQNPGPPAAPKTECGSSAQGSGPFVCMNKNRGYPGTAYVVEGGGFAARTPLTVQVSEIDPVNNKLFSQVSADKPVTGSDGSFTVPISRLYGGSLQLGLVTVTVTAPGGQAFGTQFMVIPSGAPLSGGAPPSSAA
jgi:hypothetical protein